MPFVLFHQLRWQAFGLIADKSLSENINTHTCDWRGAAIMTVSGIENQSFPQAVSSDTQNRKEVTAVRSRDDARDKPREQQEVREASPVQDQVTLSKEAQVRATSSPETLKNSTFQQSPSPFDR